MTDVHSLFPVPGPGTAPVESEFDQVERKARRRIKIIGGVIAGTLLIAVVLVCGVFGKKDPDTAVVGDCITGFMETTQVVDCSSTGANFTVVGRLKIADKPTESSLQQDCAPWPTTLVEYYDTRAHFVLCLARHGQ